MRMIQLFFAATPSWLQKDAFSDARFLVSSIAFEIEFQRKKEKLRSDIGFPFGQKTAESKIVFEQP